MPSVLTAVDHIRFWVADVARAVDTYRRLGFTVVDDGATAFASFGGFFLEFTEIESPDNSEGLGILTLRSDDIDDDVSRLRSAGVAATDPADDRVTVGQTSLARHVSDIETIIPMRLVEHQSELSELFGDPGPHPNTVTRLERVYIAVESMEHHLPEFERVLGVPAPEPEMGTVIMSLMSVFEIGGVGIAVAEPRGAGPTNDALTANGPGLFQVLFRADHLDVADRHMVEHGLPAPARGTRLSGESALLVGPAVACGSYVAMAGRP